MSNARYNLFPSKPAFNVIGSYTVTSNVFHSYATVHFNHTSSYNNTTGVFTAPVAGVYQFSMMFLGGRTANTYTVFAPYKNGTRHMSGWVQSYTGGTINDNNLAMTQLVELAENDTYELRANSTYETTYLSGYNNYCGHLVS